MFHHYVRKRERSCLYQHDCLNQRGTLMKMFIESQFSYCLLVRMFHGRIVNKNINHLHKRVLGIVYKDYISSFEDLLNRNKSVAIPHRNIQSLVIELFKVKQNFSNSMLFSIFQTRSITYNVRTQQISLEIMPALANMD